MCCSLYAYLQFRRIEPQYVLRVGRCLRLTGL